MSKYTKGEWRFNGRDIVVGQNIGQQRICSIIEHRLEYKDEDDANARLITAAPDLLAACKAAFTAATIRLDTYAESESKQAEIIEQLRTAIDKAEKIR